MEYYVYNNNTPGGFRRYMKLTDTKAIVAIVHQGETGAMIDATIYSIDPEKDHTRCSEQEFKEHLALAMNIINNP